MCVQIDFTSQQGSEAPANTQTESETGIHAVQLLKTLENQFAFFLVNAAAGIGDREKCRIFRLLLNENAQGTGLGLSICQLIIEQLGGSIWIDPDYEEGSRFLFTHPIDKSDQGKEETR